MVQPRQYQRFMCVGLLLLLGFIGLMARLADLQWWRHQELRAKALSNTQRLVVRQSRRGDILDVRGNLLATSMPVKTLVADPVLIGPYPGLVAQTVAPILHLNEQELQEKLQLRLRPNGRPDRYVVVKRKVSQGEWKAARAAMRGLWQGLNLKHMSRRQREFIYNLRHYALHPDTVDSQLREYPNGSLGAHVLGFVGDETIDTSFGPIHRLAGRSGIEYTFNQQLSGAVGWLETEKDGYRHELVAYRDQDVAPRDGLDVVLTLDMGVQDIVERELAAGVQREDPLGATAIVVRPQTGEILAMANYPTFDPNHPGDAHAGARRNRAITDVMEPGSTFKIVVVSGAINDHLVGLFTPIFCEHGSFRFAGHVLHDHGSGYGDLPVEQVIAKSSNIGAAKIGIRMGANRLYDYIQRFGFGQKTGIPLLGEVDGLVHPLSQWSQLSISRIPMGQGIAVTPLQMVMAMAAIANGGKLMRPMLVDHLLDPAGRVVAQYQPQMVRRVISRRTARLMVEALKKVVSREGTAPRAALDHYVVAGKTGTAQKAIRGGYSHTKFFASFIGFFPADDPQVCISVVMNEPKHNYYGGTAAAPVFHAIAERVANYLGILPAHPLGTSMPGVLAVGPLAGPEKRVAEGRR